MKKYKLEDALKEAKIIFPNYKTEIIEKACKYFTDYMNGDCERNPDLLKNQDIKKVYGTLMLGARMDI